MGHRNDESSGGPHYFGVIVVFVCFAAFGATMRLASGVSSADGASGDAVPASSTDRVVVEALPAAELRALAQQTTLRVAARGCGEVIHGSGFIVGDWLLTNEHLVNGVGELKADQPIEPIIVPVVGVSASADLAAAVAPPGVSLALSLVPPEVGDTVLLAGHADGESVEVQAGVVTNLVPGSAYGLGSEVLLIDATTRGGYSGGPVLDAAGDVVAILSGFDRTTGLTVAVPAEAISNFVEMLPQANTADPDGARVCSGR